eukprot:7590771-Pyramimonas_sp.AAC.1
MSFTITANPHCEDAPLLVKAAADTESVAGQPASSSAGTPAMSGAHACMMSQDTRGICFSINEETLAFTIQSLVNNTLKTWHRRNAPFGNAPPHAGRPGLRLSELAGEGLSGHLRGGQQ